MRLHWGCGPNLAPGWVNSDRDASVLADHHGDLLDGLPWADKHFDYIVTNHALQMIAYHDLPAALRELHRVLKPAGWLRILVPDLETAIDEYYHGVAGHGLVADATEPTDGGKLCAYLTWYGEARSVFVNEYLQSLLHRAGFSDTIRMPFGATMCDDSECASLDSRPVESLIVEAQR